MTENAVAKKIATTFQSVFRAHDLNSSKGSGLRTNDVSTAAAYPFAGSLIPAK